MNKLQNDVENDWTQVALFSWFDRGWLDGSSESCMDPRDQMQLLRQWCQDNITPNYWTSAGVTIFSYRFYFNNPEDATFFKLTFGI